MPLSPEEQRILQDIEKSFYEHDPQFSRKVSETTIYRVGGRNLKWLALGFVAGLVLLLWSFTQSVFLASWASSSCSGARSSSSATCARWDVPAGRA